MGFSQTILLSYFSRQLLVMNNKLISCSIFVTFISRTLIPSVPFINVAGTNKTNASFFFSKLR